MATLQDINAELESLVRGKRPEPKEPSVSDLDKFRRKPSIADLDRFRKKRPQINTTQVDNQLKEKGVPVDTSFFGTIGRALKDVPSDIGEGIRGIGKTLKKGAEDVAEIKEGLTKPTGGVTGGVKRITEPIGAFFKPVVGVLGEAVITGLKTFTTDEFEKEVSQKLGETIGKSETARNVIEWWQTVPEDDKDIIVNSASAGEFLLDLLGGTAAKKGVKKGFQEVSEQTVKSAQEVGEQLVKKADEGFLKQAEDIVTPRLEDLTKKQRGERIKDVEEGLLRRKLKPNEFEKESAQEVANLISEGKLKANASSKKGYDAVDEAISVKAQKLESDLASNSIVVQSDQIGEVMDRAIKELEDNVLIVGDAKKKAEKIVTIYRKALEKSDQTAEGLLRARKKGDEILKKQTKGKSFDPDSENALTLATREVRDSLNNELIRIVEDVDVKESLRQQSALFRARDVLQDRFAGEPVGLFGRILKAVQTGSGIPRSEVAELLILAGGAKIIPAIGTVALPVYAVNRLIKTMRSPAFNKKVGSLLKKSKNPNARKALNEFQDFRKGFLPTSSLRKRETDKE